MRKVFKFVGSVILGVVVIAAVLLLFSPIGHFACGPSRCMDGDSYGQGNWVLSGIIGIIATVLIFAALFVAWQIGDWTKKGAHEIKHEIDLHVAHRRLARQELAALEDNGEPEDDFPHSI